MSALSQFAANLSMIVKRNTKNLDKNHLLSGTLESISENTVDGITGPLFYFAFFGILGAFIYRVINTFDSMIGYKTNLFRNVGWFVLAESRSFFSIESITAIACFSIPRIAIVDLSNNTPTITEIIMA